MKPETLTLTAALQMGSDSLLTPAETASVLRISNRSLENWRSLGQGPRFTRIGSGRVRYIVRDVLAFAGVTA